MERINIHHLAGIARRWQRGEYVSFPERMAVIEAAAAGVLMAEVSANLNPSAGIAAELVRLREVADEKIKDALA